MKKALLLTALLALVLTACNPAAVNPGRETDDPADLPEPTATPQPTPTEQPPVVLTICTASLPETSFLYAGPTTPAKSRLMDLLYPPAYDAVSYRLEPIEIRRGQMVIDASGQLKTAGEGVVVRPSDCRESACAVTWNGLDPLVMDQMVIDFDLRAGLVWNDGTPLTPADAVFSYHLVSEPATAAFGWAEAYTASFDARDAQTLVWRGLPGFAAAETAPFFWTPVPAHRFDAGEDYARVAEDPLWQVDGPGYGPFDLAARGADTVELVRNPAYPYPDEAFPGVDRLVLRRLAGGAADAWDALQAGACDALDASFALAEDPELLAAVQSAPGYTVQIETGDAPTQLVFGIRPAAYDTLANPVFAERKDIFADPRTRQAFALCIDSQALAAQTGSVSALPADLAYDPAAGAALLAEAGWVDHDGDPSTPRLSQNALGVFNLTPLEVTLLLGSSPFHQELAAGIARGLQGCGVGVAVETLPTPELYAPGPQGPLFGRAFDLALIAWQPRPGPLCALYTSGEVPAAANGWIGTNIAGFADAGYDALCAEAVLATPGEAAARAEAVQAAFAQLLPALPLVTPVTVTVWRSAADGE